MKHEILSLLLKLWLICVICFIIFCVSRYFNHFPKHEKQAEAILPAEVEMYEAVRGVGNSYKIIRRVK